MNWFKLYIGDYQRDTAHLSITEHGAYQLMLQHYYATERPLPAGKALHRMLRAQDKAERDAIDTVAAQFWTETPAGLVNHRADVEIGKAGAQADTNRSIALAREARRKAARQGDETSTNRATNDQPNQTPDTRLTPSVPDGTGASPPSAPAEVQAKPLTAKERVWLLGVPLLGDTAASRSLLGKLSKTYGEDALARVLAEATADPPAEPKSWLVAACEAAKTRTNGHHQPDMLDNPTPDWALQAGFDNRFLAESAGCGPGNFHKFAAGRRVTT